MAPVIQENVCSSVVACALPILCLLFFLCPNDIHVTILLYHYTIIVFHYTIILLYYYITIIHYSIILLYYNTTILIYYHNALLLFLLQDNLR